MNIEQLTYKVNETVDKWITVVCEYSFEVLLRKPGSESWSLGQIAMHIVTETGYYIGEINMCLGSRENCLEEMTEEARTMFSRNSFPDIRIKRDASLFQSYPQPESMIDMREKLEKLKLELNQLLNKIGASECEGKTRHPGLGYFNAREWMQFAEMHMRHHLRQKDRVEEWLSLQ